MGSPVTASIVRQLRRRLTLCAWVMLAGSLAGTPSRAQDGGAERGFLHVGPLHHRHAFQYAVYDPSFLDQRATVAIRCLGVAPHPRRHGSIARFHVEMHNTTDEELELVRDALLVDWARENRLPERLVEPEGVDGRTELDPGERSRVRVAFFLREDEPDEVHLLRFQLGLASDTGTRVLLRPVFTRGRAGHGEAGRFRFVPAYDPLGNVGPPRWVW